MKKAVLVTLLVGLSILACSTTQPTAEYPPIDTLVVDESGFSDEWQATDPDTTPPPRAPWSGPGHLVEYIRQSFYSPSELRTGAWVEIQRYDSVQAAAKEYDWGVEVFFRNDAVYAWSAPVGVVYESPIADQSQYACTTGSLGCIYYAQYKVYVYYCNVRIHDTDTITYTDVLPVLFQAIDAKMELTSDSEE